MIYLENIYIFFLFFPFIKIINFGTDVQPNAMVLGSLIVLFYFLKNKRINKLLVPFLVVMIISFVLLLVDFSSNAIRSTLNYVSLFIITFASYLLFKKDSIKVVKKLKLAVYFWLIVGVIQKFLKNDFLYFLLPRGSTTVDRGVISLAPEPTFYGMIILMISLIIYWENKNDYKNILICLFQIVFLASSSMTILYIVVLFLLLLLKNMRIKNIIVLTVSTIICVIACNYIVNKFMIDTRFYQLLNLINDNPKLIINDASINDRISHVYFSIRAFFEDSFIPHGFNSWENYLKEKVAIQDIFWNVSIGGRIMSGYGAPLFELGLIGLTIPLTFAKIISSAFEGNRDKIIWVIFISLMMLSAITLSLPTVSLVLGYLLNRNRRIKDIKGEKRNEDINYT